ncbi:MAG: Arc family DNA-binding protein [Acidobacteriia bacterium]|nr:Arc family DNA-binding protein [Terriglobia bacterium]
MRKNFPLRIDARLFDQVRRWADDDLRSLNGQIEFLLREALRKSGRLKEAIPAEAPTDSHEFVKLTEE